MATTNGLKDTGVFTMAKKYSGVRPKSKSSIEIDFYYHGIRCRETIKLKPIPQNLNYAAKRKAKIEIDIAHGTFDYAKEFPDSSKAKLFAKNSGDIITVREYLTEWLVTIQNSVKASTLHNYRKIINNRLIPAFGDKKLSELEICHIKDWIKTCNCTLKTLNNLISPLRCALKDAVYDGYIDNNILYGWTVNRRDVKKTSCHKVDPFTPEEQQLILNALDGQKRNLIQFAFWTGLRTSELVAMNWEDVDFEAGHIHINKALTQAADEPETPKTLAGERKVKLLEPALNALKAQKCFTRLKNEEVFQNPKTKTRWTGDQSIRRTLWIPALEKAGVKYRNPYQTRHTYASMMLSAGENIMWVSKQMGHKDSTITTKTYARFLEHDDDDAGGTATRLFKTPGGE